MKEKTILKQKLHYQLYEVDSLKAYLEEMAFKGWRLKELNDNLLFEKTEPQLLTYAVEIFEKGTGTQEEPSPEMLEYVECCKAASWEFVAHYGHLVIFVTERDDLIPIETDEEQKFRVIKKSIWKSDFLMWLFSSVAFFVYIFLKGFAISFTNEIESLLTFFFIGKSISPLINLFKFFQWKIRARKSMKKYGYMQTSVPRKLKAVPKWIHAIYILAMFLWVLLNSFIKDDYTYTVIATAVVVVYCVVRMIWYYLENSKNNNDKNIQIIILSSIVVFFVAFYIAAGVYSKIDKSDSIPSYDISLKNIYENIPMQDERISSQTDSTILASHTKCFLLAEDKNDKMYSIEYTVFKSRLPLLNYLYAFREKRNIVFNKYEEVDPSEWGAKAAYKEKDRYGQTIIVFDDVVFTYKYIELDKNDIAYIKEAIGVE